MSMQAYNQYMNLINQGMPYQQAYFESGLGDIAQQNQEIQRQQAEEQQRILASQQGRAGRQQLGGQLVGALATKGAYNYLMNKPLFGETGAAIGNKLGIESKLLGSTGGTSTVAAAPAPIPIDVNAPMSMMPVEGATAPMSTMPTDNGGMSMSTDTGEGGFDLGSAIQGGLGAYNLYQGIEQFRQGDKLEGALGGGVGAVQLGAALGEETAKQFAPGVGALYGGYQLGKLMLDDDIRKGQAGRAAASGATSGAAIGSYFGGPIGAGIGAIIGGTLGAIKGLSGSGKGEMQTIRDKWRDAMIESDVGLFDPETYEGTLPDGTKFNWGKDRFGFGNEEAKGDINLKENPVHGQAASYGNLMTTLMGMGPDKANEAIAAQYTLASLADNEGSTANATDQQVRDRFRYFMQKNEFDLPAAEQHIAAMLEQGKIDQEYHDIQQNNLRMLMNDELMEQKAATQGVQ